MFYKCFRFFSVAFIIDTARVNARAVAEAQDTGVKIPANRFFAFAIVRALVTPHIQRRMTRPGVQRFVKVNAECYLCECFFLFIFQNIDCIFYCVVFTSVLDPHKFLCGSESGIPKMSIWIQIRTQEASDYADPDPKHWCSLF